MKEITRRDFIRQTLIGTAGLCLFPKELFSRRTPFSLPSPLEVEGPPNFAIADGWHFTETRGDYPYPYGYSIQGSMWEVFRKYGGASFWGPAISRQYKDELGRDCQAAQRGVLQLSEKVELMNVFDEIEKKGVNLDNQTDLIPQSLNWNSDGGKSWTEIRENHLRIFSSMGNYPELERAYFASPLWLEQYGLPMSFKDYGRVVVLKCQRGALQLWKDKTPWTTKPGEVVSVLTGELVKKYGLIPVEALVPTNPGMIETAGIQESSTVISRAFSLINESRRQNSLSSLSPSSLLERVAKSRVEQVARQAVENNIFSHFGPNGENLFIQTLTDFGCPDGYYLEILGRTSASEQIAEALIGGFLNSSTHRNCILWDRACSLGVSGRYELRDGRFYLAGVFSDNSLGY